MKPTPSFIATLSIALVTGIILPGQSQEPVVSLLKLERRDASTPSAPAVLEGQSNPSWELTERSRDTEVWSVAPRVDRLTGRRTGIGARFTMVGTGINYKDEFGRWQPTRPEFELTPQGYAVVRFGPHRLIVENNINSPTAIDFLTDDGVRLRSAPLAIGFYDPADGRNFILATARDTAGALTGPAEITFRSCFEGLDASIRVTSRRAGMSCDLVLHEAPPDPTLLGLSEHARLELYTEFSADSPVPTQAPRTLRRENDAALRQTLVDPDFVDHVLDYGNYKMGTGEAFEGGDGGGNCWLPSVLWCLRTAARSSLKLSSTGKQASCSLPFRRTKIATWR